MVPDKTAPNWLKAGPVSALVADLPQPTGDRTRLAVLSDLHLTQEGCGGWKLLHRTTERFRTALATVERMGVDGVVIGGDLTWDGDPVDFRRISNRLSESGIPSLCVPGNHDITSDSRPFESFERTVAPTDAAFPFVRRVGSVDVVGVNSVTLRGPDGPSGFVTEPQLARLEPLLENLATPLVVLHHPTIESWSATDALDPAHVRLENAETLRTLLREHDVPLVVSGHAHWPLAATESGLHQIVAPATSSYPQSFLLIEVSTRGTTVSLIPIPGREAQRSAYERLCTDGPLDGSYARIAESDYFDQFPLLNPS